MKEFGRWASRGYCVYCVKAMYDLGCLSTSTLNSEGRLPLVVCGKTSVRV